MRTKEIADRLGLSPETLRRWERAGRIEKPTRDQKGWRKYSEDDLSRLRALLKTMHPHGVVEGAQ